MALKWYEYDTEDGLTKYIQAEENVVALYADIVKRMSDGVVEAAGVPTAETVEPADEYKLPSSIQYRRLILQIPGFGQGLLPIFTNRALDGLTGITGNDWSVTLKIHNLCDPSDPEAPLFPVDVSTEGDLTVQCIGYQGERRLSN